MRYTGREQEIFGRDRGSSWSCPTCGEPATKPYGIPACGCCVILLCKICQWNWRAAKKPTEAA